MNDQTARLVHWLSDGRSAALVAPAVKAATSPAARGVVNRARSGDLLDEIDVERARRIIQRLGDDAEFRRSMGVAAGRVRTAVERSDRRRRGGRVLLVIALLAAAGAVAAAVLKRAAAPSHGGVSHDDGLRPSAAPVVDSGVGSAR
ncbi:MAG: hypothetical protein IT200_05925 [Thermoleophilia bacterium]|nr:hypothetical protein [Thermoleophilia bacterium]